MAPRQHHSSSSIEESPLLTNKTSLGNSTINPNKLDQARFTEIRDMESESSPLRIIIYVIIVIVIGVGAALVVKNIISNKSNEASNSSSSSSQSDIGNSVFTISKVPADDSMASNLGKNADYVDSLQLALGDSTADKSGMSLDKMSYSKFTTFARIGFMFTTTDSKLPKTTIDFDDASNKLTVSFPDVQNIADGLKQTFNIGDLVASVQYNASTNNFTLIVSDKFKYRYVKDGSNLYIDIKTLTDLAKPDTVTSSSSSQSSQSVSSISSSSSSSSIASGSAPAAPHYNNDFSQDRQYISSNVNTNSIADNVYYFDSYGAPSYEFSWGQKGAIGDSVTPNSTAYYDTSTPGKVYLIVEISNLSKEVFTANGVTGRSASEIQSQTGVNTAGTNFNRIDLLSFTNGTAKYRFDLQRQTDFKLWMDKTVDGKTGTISITIKN